MFFNDKSSTFFYSLKFAIFFFLFSLFLLIDTASCDYVVEAKEVVVGQGNDGQEREQRYDLSQLSGDGEGENKSKDGILERWQNLSSKEKRVLVGSLVVIGCLIGVIYLQQSDISQLDSKISNLDKKVSNLSSEVSELKKIFTKTVTTLNEKVKLVAPELGESSSSRSEADRETWVRPPGWKFGFG